MVLTSQVMMNIFFLPSTVRITVAPLANYGRLVMIISGETKGLVFFSAIKWSAFIVKFWSGNIVIVNTAGGLFKQLRKD